MVFTGVLKCAREMYTHPSVKIYTCFGFALTSALRHWLNKLVPRCHSIRGNIKTNHKWLANVFFVLRVSYMYLRAVIGSLDCLCCLCLWARVITGFGFGSTQLKSALLRDVRLNDNTPGSATSFTSYLLFSLNLNLLPSFLRNFVLASPASGLLAVWEARCGLGQNQERSTFFVR